TDPYTLEAFSLTPSEVTNKISSYNRNISGGTLEEMGTKYIIKGVSELGSIDELGQIVLVNKQLTTSESSIQTVGTTEDVLVYLRDVADIRLVNKEPENIVRLNGVRCLALAAYKETRYNTVKVVNDFLNTLEDIRNEMPGYELPIIQNKGEFITSSIAEVQQTLLMGILLAVIILYVFLRRIGTTAIISVAIPVSIIATFNLMYFNGLTLNIMTLGGLALGAGMLVDNAIVVMENIFRNMEEGMSLKEAVLTGTDQVAGAITASTVTTIIVFLPIVYLHGSAGELFRDQAWTVTFSLLSSLLVAVLVIPMLSVKILSEKNTKKYSMESIRFPRYAKFLEKVLKYKYMVILAAAALIAGGVFLIPVIGSEFVPKSETNEYTVEIKLPEGTELQRTANTVAGIEETIRSMFAGDIESAYSISGPSSELSGVTSSVFQSENTATLKILFNEEFAVPDDTVFSMIDQMLSEIPELEFSVFQEQTTLELTLGDETAPLVIEIQGEDLDVIRELTERIKTDLSGFTELYNIKTSFDEGRPEIDIVIDPVSAGIYNIGVETIISELQSLLMGSEAGQIETDGELRDMTLRLPKISVRDLEDISIGSAGSNISLYSVADIRIKRAPAAIYRNDQVRVGKLSSNLNREMPLDKVVNKIESSLSNITFPPDYKYLITGEEQKRKEAFANLRFALILSLVLVYMVLASQFESLIHPFTVILSIPLAIVGAVFIFFVLGKSLNIMAYIGIIMLVGIAVNDSIILVDAINQLKREGRSRTEAIIEAGQRRIRPIIMTSLTTILALTPLTIGIGEGASLRAPMALAVIGGLITATLLTLVVIPCVYAVMDTLTGIAVKDRTEQEIG
ncbi:efflux RND transporter permease subunit, partial [candidate division KSB1 bacterium]